MSTPAPRPAHTTGKDALLSILEANGVQYIFGNPGTTEQALLDALQDHPELSYVLCLQESVALAAADGYARAARKPAFVNLHATPGLGNAMGQLFNSYRHGTPLIVTAGQSDTRLSQMEPTLGSDLVELMRPMVKWAAEARTLGDIPMLMRRAFKDAMQPPQRPVFISLPTDVMDAEGDVDISIAPTVNTATVPDDQSLDQAADLIRQAARPAVICGEGVAKSDAMVQVINFAELTGAAVFTQRPTEVAFPTNHPQYAGAAPRVPVDPNPLAPYDVVFITGMAVFPHIFFPARPLLPPDSKIIHLDPDSWEVGRNLPVDQGLVGDIKLTIDALTKRVAKSADDEYSKAADKRRQELAEQRTAADQALPKRIDAAKEQHPMAPLAAFATLADEMPPGTLVFDDAVSNSPVLNEAIGQTEAGTRFLTTHRAGAIGWALGAAIGGQLARPDRRIVAVAGDGAAMYSIQALWTAAHHKLPIIFLIANNRSYELLKMNIRTYLQGSGRESAYLAMDLDQPCIDFVGLAQAQGVHGARVDTVADLRAALREAFSRNDSPSLIDVHVAT